MKSGYLVYLRPFPAASRMAPVYCKMNLQSQSHCFSQPKVSSVVLDTGVVAAASSLLLSLGE